MGNALIDKELIGEPRLYDLAMRLEAETLHVLLYRSGEPESIVYRAVPLDAPDCRRSEGLRRLSITTPSFSPTSIR